MKPGYWSALLFEPKRLDMYGLTFPMRMHTFMQTVSTRKDAVDAMLDNFNINAANPVSACCQHGLG